MRGDPFFPDPYRRYPPDPWLAPHDDPFRWESFPMLIQNQVVGVPINVLTHFEIQYKTLYLRKSKFLYRTGI